MGTVLAAGSDERPADTVGQVSPGTDCRGRSFPDFTAYISTGDSDENCGVSISNANAAA